MSLVTQIEALLFASDQPLPLGRLCEVLDGASRAEIEAGLTTLQELYAEPERGLCLTAVAGGWQLATKPDLAPMVRRLFTGKRRVRLTKAALESLAIIAYKQPTTRPEIDAIRGVASGGVLETLLERNLVRIAGRSEGVGRPLLYATTPEFLQYLGLNRVQDLPSLAELETMLAEREAAARLADDAEMEELAARARDAAPLGDEAGSAVEETPVLAPAARLEEKLREHDLPTLDELDAELRSRSERIQELSGRVAAARDRHLSENLDPLESGAAQAAGVDPADEAGPEPAHDAPRTCD